MLDVLKALVVTLLCIAHVNFVLSSAPVVGPIIAAFILLSPIVFGFKSKGAL